MSEAKRVDAFRRQRAEETAASRERPDTESQVDTSSEEEEMRDDLYCVISMLSPERLGLFMDHMRRVAKSKCSMFFSAWVLRVWKRRSALELCGAYLKRTLADAFEDWQRGAAASCMMRKEMDRQGWQVTAQASVLEQSLQLQIEAMRKEMEREREAVRIMRAQLDEDRRTRRCAREERQDESMLQQEARRISVRLIEEAEVQVLEMLKRAYTMMATTDTLSQIEMDEKAESIMLILSHLKEAVSVVWKEQREQRAAEERPDKHSEYSAAGDMKLAQQDARGAVPGGAEASARGATKTSNPFVPLEPAAIPAGVLEYEVLIYKCIRP